MSSLETDETANINSRTLYRTLNDYWWGVASLNGFKIFKKAQLDLQFENNYIKLNVDELNDVIIGFKEAHSGKPIPERYIKKVEASTSNVVKTDKWLSEEERKRREMEEREILQRKKSMTSVLRKRKAQISDNEDSEIDIHNSDSPKMKKPDFSKKRKEEIKKTKSIREERERLLNKVQKRATKQNAKLKAEGIDGVVINIGHKRNEIDIFIPEFMSQRLKPHQIEGVQFIWASIFMIKQKSKFIAAKNGYSGCLLADAMGL
ncbi:hypothetical protein HK096_001755, partial [Nowakowskiella sp. JEL0078]